MENICRRISDQLAIRTKQVEQVIRLLEKGNTIPFIARYRKEMTGGLDEVRIGDIQEAYVRACRLEKRREEVIKQIEEQGRMDPDLKRKLLQAERIRDIEDLYLPYRPRKRTRAQAAAEKGLERLAGWLASLPKTPVAEEAAKYLSEDKSVRTAEEAIKGAKDILAERLSENAELRALARREIFEKGVIATSPGKNQAKDSKKVYEMYYQYREQAKCMVPHRILAVNRGEAQGILRVSVDASMDNLMKTACRLLIRNRKTSAARYLTEAAEDACKRLIIPAVERELRQELTQRAEQQAIHIFSENLRGLLMQPPMKEKTILGVDPAYRTGCKLAVVDPAGKLMDVSVIYPTPPKEERTAARRKVLSLIQTYDVDLIAIGNGTASRETESFIAETLKEMRDRKIFYIMVNEAGASVYSASTLARKEFPNLQVEERSAVSIARRLQDPLAELVKVDPESIGVGEYQHDVPRKILSESLRFVVETVVNRVGVNLNTASAELLKYVAGLSRTTAENIIRVRNKLGRFHSRRQLKDVPRLGPRTFEQCAGFLRITGGSERLDGTSIHPESYDAARKFLGTVGLSAEALNKESLRRRIGQLDLSRAAAQLAIGEPTLRDIIEALCRPGRDPRDEADQPQLRADVLKPEDLYKGMRLEGTVRNVVDFGAFVDIGLKQDGLVHISKLAGHFVRHPLDVVHVGQVVTVWVDSVDLEKGRVSLSMIDNRTTPAT
ncbi:Tex family protein [Sporolactobacillus sp. Y61]|uniref:Tex family protein n=1 Tax=Sporolactobacillus sp. Y61 TaxID=3160863 RepID=A0AAU8IFN7_9BACL